MRGEGNDENAQIRRRVALDVLAYVNTTGRLPFAPAVAASRPISWKKPTFISAGVLVAVAILWVAGNMYGMRYSLQNSTMSAWMSDAKLAQNIASHAQNYQLKIAQADGKMHSFSLQSAGIQIDMPHTVAAAKQQRSQWQNRLLWWRPLPLTLTVSADTQKLEQFIDTNAAVVTTPPQNASLSVVDGDAKITDGTVGKQFGVPNPTQAVMAAASNLSMQTLYMKSSVRQPVITAASLASAKAELAAALKQQVTISMDGTTVHPDAKTVGSWITITPEPTTRTVSLGINKDSVQKYLDGLAGGYSHPSRSQVQWGGKIISSGADGATVSDTGAATATLTSDLLAGKGVKATLPVQHTTPKVVNAPTSGKWIEVDLTTKRMYMYDQNALQRTFLVTAGAPATPTVVGTYAIYSKYAQQNMSGRNADGSHYNQPNVPWVNYFYQDYAIHGNYWRPSSYFGNINSSHGCVSTSVSDAAWIYTWAPVGTPVVVHK